MRDIAFIINKAKEIKQPIAREKECATCGRVKSLSKYAKNSTHIDRKSYSCKDCLSKYTKKYGKEYRERCSIPYLKVVFSRLKFLRKNGISIDNVPEDVIIDYGKYLKCCRLLKEKKNGK